MLENIAYREYKKAEDIHGTVLYPAVMVAPVQKDILSDLTKQQICTTIFDPFHGSGTALYECIEVSDKIKIIGCDINPLANLITRTKLQGVSSSIQKDITALMKYIDTCVIEQEYKFANIDKWFRKDIQRDIQIIRDSIIKISTSQNRLFFWCMLSDIIRRYSNSRSSTYKLHEKQVNVIYTLQNKVIADFITSINNNWKYYQKSAKNFCLYKCDTLQKMPSFKTSQFDISITSPPYGDNATTVPYGQFSMLALQWIDNKDLELDGWELQNYSIIDSNSMGGRARPIEFDDYSIRLIAPYLTQIADDKQRKVIRFFNDYFVFLNQLCRVTKKYIVLTLGNRTVDRVNIDLTDISMQYLQHKGFLNKQILEREIPVKRTPRVTSIVGDSPVKSINSEYVIIHARA